MRLSRAWQSADNKIRRRAAEFSGAWLPACGEADIQRMLLLLLGEWTECTLADIDAARIPQLIAKAERMLAMERGRARSGSLAYDVNRHIGCCQLLRTLRGRLNAECGNAARHAPAALRKSV
jgi:hypothetical protein